MPIWGYILIACIAGLFALGGSFLGSRLEWKSRHRGWLLEKRAEIFAEFIRTWSECTTQAWEYLGKTEVFEPSSQAEEMARGLVRTLGISKIYMPALNIVAIVRLFLKEESRDDFEKLVQDIISLHSKGIDIKLIGQYEKGKTEIQKIFEENLRNP